MIEPHKNLTEKEKIEISVKQKKQIEKELIGNIIPHNNHTLWEINNETLSIKKAEFIKQPIVFGEKEPQKQVLQRDGYSYVSALNKANALKKFNQGKNGSKEIDVNKYKL
jgi:hypothetical protein